MARAGRSYRLRTHGRIEPPSPQLTAFLARTDLVTALRALFGCRGCFAQQRSSVAPPVRCSHLAPAHRAALDAWFDRAWGLSHPPEPALVWGMDEMDRLNAAITVLQFQLRYRHESAPNLRDFPLGGAGYTEAVAAHNAATSQLTDTVEGLAEQRTVLRRALAAAP